MLNIWYNTDRLEITVSVQQSFYCGVRIRYRGNVFTEPLHSNGGLFWLRYSGISYVKGVSHTESKVISWASFLANFPNIKILNKAYEITLLCVCP
jgi:hypothetical protein